MSFELIDENRDSSSVDVLCRALGVSRSGYYAWRSRPICARERANRILALHIKAIHRESDQTYGTPRITDELRDSGISCGHNRVAKIKRRLGLFAVATPRGYRPPTTQAASNRRVAPDLVQRDFVAGQPNKKWVSDITYVPVQGGHVYLCAILDLFSRRVVGWSISQSITTDLVITALQRACQTRRPREDVIFHSDRGTQFTSEQLHRKLAENGLTPSVGRKGDCYDNAVAEAFFSTLKIERINRDRYGTLQQARRAIERYIRFYNRTRRHSTLGNISPDKYEALRAA